MAKAPVVKRTIEDLISQHPGMKWTVRQLYYRCVSPPYQIFENTRSSYTVFDKQLVKLRERGEILDEVFIDSGRRIDGGDFPDWQTDDFLRTKIKDIAGLWNDFSRSMWERQPENVIVVIEKDALSRFVYNITRQYRTPLAVCRGYSSRTQIVEIIDLLESDKPNIILYLGDHDPSGMDIERSLVERLLREAGDDYKISCERVALTYEQALPLPPNPAKLKDTRSSCYVNNFGNTSWELDALPPNQLQSLVADAIKSHIKDTSQWNRDWDEEQQGKAVLKVQFEEASALLVAHFDSSTIGD